MSGSRRSTDGTERRRLVFQALATGYLEPWIRTDPARSRATGPTFDIPNVIARTLEPPAIPIVIAVQQELMGRTIDREFVIECPLKADGARLVRERPDGLDVAVRYAEGESQIQLLPRFMGDHCEFVPRARDFGRGLQATGFASTSCPLHPDSTDVHACFLTTAE